MAFWDDAIRNVQNFFGGGNSQKKKKDEEQRIKTVVSSPAPSRAPGITGNQPKAPQLKQLTDLFGTLNNTGQMKQPMAPKPVTVPQVKTPQNNFGLNTSLTLPTTPNNKPSVVSNPILKPLTPAPAVKSVQPAQRAESDQIPGFYVMSPAAKQQALTQLRAKSGTPEQRLENAKTALKSGDAKRVSAVVGSDMDLFKRASDGVAADKKKKDEDTAKTWGSIPIIGTGLNWGAGLAAVYGKATGNKDIEDRANNQRNLYSLGMSSEELAQYDPETQKKLEILKNVVTGAGALDIVGATSLIKAPIIGGIKKAAVEGFKTEAGKQIIKQSLKETGKQYGKNVAVGGAVSGIADPAIQAYVKDGEVDWSSVPSSMLQGSLWAAALPEFSGKSRLVQKMRYGNKVNVPTSKNIEINAPTTYKKRVPVAINNTERPLINEMTTDPGLVPQPVRMPVPIRELSGDTPGVNQVQVPTAADRFAAQPAARPDSTVEGMLPGKVEDTTLYSKAEVDTERAALDQALANGEINKTAYKAASKELDTLPLSDAPTSKVQIPVKQVRDIPVSDAPRDIPVDEMGSMPHPTNKVDVAAAAKNAPTNTNEVVQTVNPATGEKTFYRIPKDKRDSIVNQIDSASTVKQPVQLPSEVQAVLDNPKQFNKVQVKAARNQLKLAKAYAKTQEGIQEQLGRIDTASPAAQSGEGFVPTGEFSKGKKGNIRENMNINAEKAQAQQETASMSPAAVLQEAIQNKQANNAYTARDFRNIQALFDTKRVTRDMPEYAQLRAALKDIGSQAGQFLREQGQAIRRTASADEIIGRFESKLYGMVDDPTKIDSKMFDDVDVATNRFTEARDTATQAYNRFTEEPTSANAKAYHAAQDAAEKADKDAKITEYKVAQKALKGNKDIQQARELEKMAQSADMYQMDAVDASMLSGTGTFVRNFANASVSGFEEGLFGKTGARIASKLTKQNVGGGMGRGTVSGFKEGVGNIVDASKARASVAGKNPIEHAKNWATTGNQLGDAVIDSQVKHNVNDHYTQLLKSEGYKGRELRDRASVIARQDPDNVTETYQQAARVAAGLGSGITRNNKIETTVKNIISDAISGGNPNKYTEGTAKLITRLTLGFPTAIGRSVVEGGKRFTLGAPTFIRAAMAKDPQVRATLIKEGVKQAGSGGLVIPSLFYGLGASGVITGGYPEDKAEQERWAREGITENSIKIGDDYYQLPAYLGSWAIPSLFYASLGRNGGDWGAAATDVAKAAPDLLPTGGIDSVLDVVNGRKDIGKYMSQLIPSAVRASTPAGALLNQLAKTFDPTQNDTNSGTVTENIVSKIMSGIPGLANTLPDKTDAEGNVLTNPNPLSLALGASSTTQQAGVEQTQVLNDQTNSAIQSMNDTGAFSDPNLKALITDEATKKIYTNITSGKQVSPADLEKVQKAMVKGVSENGTDTAYLEREQYDTNLTVLNLKRQLMAADPTTKPSDLKQMDTAIKRGEVYRDNEVPYELISAYQDTSLTDWRAMGNPESDEYDPDMYQQLWAIDEMMANAGVSYKKGALDKQKYSAKGSGKGGRGGSGSKMGTDFGKLSTLTGAPSVQAYDTIDSKSGSIPVIQVQRPNIVHKISSSG